MTEGCGGLRRCSPLADALLQLGEHAAVNAVDLGEHAQDLPQSLLLYHRLSILAHRRLHHPPEVLHTSTNGNE